MKIVLAPPTKLRLKKTEVYCLLKFQYLNYEYRECTKTRSRESVEAYKDRYYRLYLRKIWRN